MSEKTWLRLPVVSAGAEYLVMGHLMRRNILTYKAPPNHEGYDLICIHPDPRHRPGPGEVAQVRVQVKSHYATDCDRGFPVREASLDAFDSLPEHREVLRQERRDHRGAGAGVLHPPREFIRQHHEVGSVWQKVRLKNLDEVIALYKDGLGFELIAGALGVPRPTKKRAVGGDESARGGHDTEVLGGHRQVPRREGPDA